MAATATNPRATFVDQDAADVAEKRRGLAARKAQNRADVAALSSAPEFALLITAEGKSGQSPERNAAVAGLRMEYNSRMQAFRDEYAAIEREEFALNRDIATVNERAKRIRVGIVGVSVPEVAANLQRQSDAGSDSLRAEHETKSQRDAQLTVHYTTLSAKLIRLQEFAETLKTERVAGAPNPAKEKENAVEIQNTSAAMSAIVNERNSIGKRLPAIGAEVAERQRTAEIDRQSRVLKAIRPAAVRAVRLILDAAVAWTYLKRLARLTDTPLPAFSSLELDADVSPYAQELVQEMIDSGWLLASDIKQLEAAGS